MADQGQNPFAAFTPEQQKSIEQQLRTLRESGKLNEKQNTAVGKALLHFVPEGTKSFKEAEPGGRGILGKVGAAVGVPWEPRRYAAPIREGGPIISPSELLPNKQFTNPTRAGAVARGVGDVAGSFTTPDNILATMMTMGVGDVQVAKALGSIPGLRQIAMHPKLAKMTISRALGLWFAGQGGKGLLQESPEIKKAWNVAKNDPSEENIAEVTRLVAGAVANSAVLGAGAAHGAGFDMPLLPKWMKKGEDNIPTKISLGMEAELVDKLGWSREQVRHMQPDEAHSFIKNGIRAEDYKPPAKPESSALVVRPKKPSAEPLETPKGKPVLSSNAMRDKEGRIHPLPPVPKPPEEMGPPAQIEGKPGEPVPIVQGGRSAYYPGVPQEMQGLAHWLDDRRETLLRELKDSRKRNDEKAAADAEKQLKVIDRRRVSIGASQESPSAEAQGRQGTPEVPKPPSEPTQQADAPKGQETQSSPTRGSEPPANRDVDVSPSGEAAVPGATGASPQPKVSVAEIPTKDVIADPRRFQFRSLPRAGLSDVSKYRPELSGILTVWKDPADGKTYVVNGHHRLDLANRSGTSTVRVQYIEAANAQEARSTGALINIAEGSADPIDAARFIRDTGHTPESLEGLGVSLSGPVAGDAVALAKLSPPIFQQVLSGEMPTGRAVAIGKYLADPAEQEALVQLIKQQGQKGERLNNGEIEALARYVKSKGTTTTSEPSLFGNQEIRQSNAIEHAQLEAYIKKRLSKDKRLFGFVAKGPRAEELKRAGNIIDVDKSAQIAQAAKVSEEVFNKLLDRAGPLASALSEGAQRIASGEDAQRVRSETYEKALNAISETLGRSTEETNRAGETPAPKAGGAGSQPEAPVKPITTAESMSGRAPRRFRETVAQPPPPPQETAEAAPAPVVREGESGGAIRTFADQTVAPTAREAAKNVVASASWLRRTFAPETVDGASKRMALITSDKWAWLENERTRTHEAMREFRKHFADMPREARIRAMMQYEERGPDSFSDPVMRRNFQLWKQLQSETWREVAKRRGIKTFIEHFFPHMWKNPEEASRVYGQVYSKRPLEGPKSFFKKRGIPSIADGLAAGLELVSDNPVDMMEGKLHEMRRYIAGHDIMEEAKQNGMVQFHSVYKSAKDIPEGLKRIEGPLGTVYGKPGMTIKEAYDMNLMDDLNNFARSIGVKHYRKVSLGNGILGYTTWPGDKVFTRFATPLGVLTHEIGHQLDFRYGLAKEMVKHPEFKQELRDLADERYRGKDPDSVSPHYKKYVRQGPEKMANLVDAMVNAPDLVQRVAPRSLKFLREFMAQHDDLKPFLDIKPSLARAENSVEIKTPGIPLLGHLYMPDGAALILNNHLSPGLRQTSPLFRGYLSAANSMNRFQLGWSLFHFTFTGIDAGISKFELGMRQFLQPGRGETRGLGLKNMGKGIIPGYGTLETFFRGRAKELQLLEHGPAAEVMNLGMRDILNKAGGRIKMDAFYRDSSLEKFWDAWRSGNKIGAGFRAPGALVEWVSKPIMDDWVPRLKLGVFFDMAQHELSRLPENADVFQQREALSKAWSSVDNRLGQLVYDNLFWNKALKDLGLASVRSLGWNLGSIREFGGGTIDLAKGRITPKSAYIIALPIVVGMQGAMLTYLLTGKGPQELKDYYFPRTGKTNPDGTPERLSFPSYAKDLYNYGEGFRYGIGEGLSGVTSTVSNKLNPMLGTVMDMLNNRDFYGVKIRNSDDPAVQQLKDVMTYLGNQFMPLSASAFARRHQETGAPLVSAESLESVLGLMPAPKSVERTKAEFLTAKYMNENMPRGARDRKSFERAQLRGEIIRRMKLKDEGAYNELMHNIQSGEMSFEDRSQVLERVRKSSLETGFTHLGIEKAIIVYESANEKERELLKPLLLQKAANTRRLSPADWVKMREKVMQLIGENQEPQTPRTADVSSTFRTPEIPPPPQ